MSTFTDKSVELGYARKPAKRLLSASGKWKHFKAVAHDFVSLARLSYFMNCTSQYLYFVAKLNARYNTCNWQAHAEDEWSYIVDSFPTEQGTRYRYDITKREFFTDQVSVKIDTKVGLQKCIL